MNNKLPVWFNPADADNALWEKFGPQEPGLLVRLYFMRRSLNKESQTKSKYIWVLWLPNKQFRYFPDPAQLSIVWYTAKFHDTEVKAFDQDNMWDLPEEYMDTIYLPETVGNVPV